MLIKMTGVTIGYLGLDEWMPLLGPYPLADEVGMGIAYNNLEVITSEGQICGEPSVRYHVVGPHCMG